MSDEYFEDKFKHYKEITVKPKFKVGDKVIYLDYVNRRVFVVTSIIFYKSTASHYCYIDAMYNEKKVTFSVNESKLMLVKLHNRRKLKL